VNHPSPAVRSLADLPCERHVVTIGSFDGVHRGHQHLIQQVVDRARISDCSGLGITFDPLPAEVLRPDKAPPRVCTTVERTKAMLDAGLDRIVLLDFDHAMANQSADEFLAELVRYANPEAIIVGEDFAFGHKRQGTPEFLKTQAEAYGFEVTVVPRINPDNEVEWSSSFIRNAVAEHGDVRSASLALGRMFSLSGRVGDGDKRGRTLGYPTANLQPPDGMVTPADGIYAALVDIESSSDERDLPSLVYIGNRPTFDGMSRVVEVYILDFDADLYDKLVTIRFVDRVRGDQAFDSPQSLIDQMQRDEEAGRQILADFGANVRTKPGR
jgi:riboflavin kinase / FMN adenylyltransferase